MDGLTAEGQRPKAFRQNRGYFLDVLHAVTAAVGTKAIGPLTGAMLAAMRQAIIDQFTAQPDPCVVVSQIEAAGVGLNIQAASVVIITEKKLKHSDATPRSRPSRTLRLTRFRQRSRSA